MSKRQSNRGKGINRRPPPGSVPHRFAPVSAANGSVVRKDSDKSTDRTSCEFHFYNSIMLASLQCKCFKVGEVTSDP